MKSDLGLTLPMTENSYGSVFLPSRGKEKAARKGVRKRAEEGKVAIRNIRRDTNEELKKLEKEKH